MIQVYESVNIIKNDSFTIPLDEIFVLDRRKFKTKDERRYYYWYYKKIQRAYPYAQIAADMANFIAYFAGYQKNEIQRSKAKEALVIITREYQNELQVVDLMDKTLLKLREAGVYDYFEQSKQLNESYTLNKVRLDQETAILKVYENTKVNLPDTLIVKTRARVNGYQAAINAVKPQLDLLKKYNNCLSNL